MSGAAEPRHEVSLNFRQFCGAEPLGVLSHHLRCGMKSPHLVYFSWDFADFQSNLSQILADFQPILGEISRA